MHHKEDSLKTYKQRRDFSQTKEPQGSQKESYSKKPIFVIQKHAASHLHYDLRLEIDGVLKSWAIPKGPTTNPKIKRLAMPTEDHPREYATFEGVIPEGNYGAGTVMVWDLGTYENIKKVNSRSVPMSTCYKHGQIEVVLHGKKLHGKYALIRLKTSLYKQGGWLLIKMSDEYAQAKEVKATSNTRSVLTGRTMLQIKKDADEQN